MYIQYDASSLQSASVNGAPLVLLSGSNSSAYVRAFDDTTEEFVKGKFRLPTTLNGSGTVIFEASVMSSTAATNNVEHRIGHVALEDSEDFDVAYTDVDSGDKAIDDSQGSISIHTWSETVATLGWAAGDLVLFQYSRITPDSDNLSGDMYLLHLTIKLPV